MLAGAAGCGLVALAVDHFVIRAGGAGSALEQASQYAIAAGSSVAERLAERVLPPMDPALLSDTGGADELGRRFEALARQLNLEMPPERSLFEPGAGWRAAKEASQAREAVVAASPAIGLRLKAVMAGQGGKGVAVFEVDGGRSRLVPLGGYVASYRLVSIEGSAVVLRAPDGQEQRLTVTGVAAGGGGSGTTIAAGQER